MPDVSWGNLAAVVSPRLVMLGTNSCSAGCRAGHRGPMGHMHNKREGIVMPKCQQPLCKAALEWEGVGKALAHALMLELTQQAVSPQEQTWCLTALIQELATNDGFCTKIALLVCILSW